jgi:hypothetical protein
MCELQLMVGIMSCTALLTTLCVKGGTHPFDRNIDSKAVYADLRGAIINNRIIYPCMWNECAGRHLTGSPLA